RPSIFKAPPDLWTWSGGYLGPNMGYSWGRSDTTANFVNGTTNGQLFSVNGRIPANDFSGGGQLGANWQQGTWVYGVEADLQGTAERARTAFDCPAGVCAPLTRGASANFNQRLTWFGTVRGRLGMTPIEHIFVYATGGLAYGRIETLGSVS